MADKEKKDEAQEEESHHEVYTPVHTPEPSASVPERTILRTAINPDAGHQHPDATISLNVDDDDNEIDIEERPSDTESIRQLRQRRRRFQELRRDHYNRMYYDEGSIIHGSHCLDPEPTDIEVSSDNANEGEVEKEKGKPEDKDKPKK
ncbi:Hypothetical predicted protein [Drosophila guanche]|uniref:Uncharacterized protein n=1 Tax=Drosophila guanche TaxID=7266 RepID=A0A3B0K374_DROGU|nr:Hypothetical predicted protein [Drosophila guanche]